MKFLYIKSGQVKGKKCHNSVTDRATDLPFSPYALEFHGLTLHGKKMAIFETLFFTLYRALMIFQINFHIGKNNFFKFRKKFLNLYAKFHNKINLTF